MITGKQLKKRKNYLGSSDAPAIVGYDPWRNAADVYHEKISEISDHQKDNDSIVVGKFCEASVLEWFEAETGLKTKKNQFRVHKNGIMAANLDAIASDGSIVEAKTAGIVSPLDRDAWGEIGTNQIPGKYIIQCHHQMAVMGPDVQLVWVPVLLGSVGFRIYQVERDQEIIDGLEVIEKRFWKENILKLIPPQDTPGMDILKRIERQPKKSVQLPEGIITAWVEAKKKLAEISKEKDLREREMINALGDAEIGESPIGSVTYYEQKRGSYTVSESTFRVLRLKESITGGK